MLAISDRIQIPDHELQLTFARSSAPGGQNVNKVNSKAVLRWNIQSSPSLPPDVRARFVAAFGSRITVDGDVVLQSDAHRDQPRNIEDCKEKLRAMILQVLVPPKPRRKTRPTRGSVQRRLEGKTQQGQKKRNRSTFDDG